MKGCRCRAGVPSRLTPYKRLDGVGPALLPRLLPAEQFRATFVVGFTQGLLDTLFGTGTGAGAGAALAGGAPQAEPASAGSGTRRLMLGGGGVAADAAVAPWLTEGGLEAAAAAALAPQLRRALLQAAGGFVESSSGEGCAVGVLSVRCQEVRRSVGGDS